MMHAVIFTDESDAVAVSRLEARMSGFRTVRVPLGAIDQMVLGGDGAAIALWSPAAAALGMGQAIACSPSASAGRLLVVRTVDAPDFPLPAGASRVAMIELSASESALRGALGLLGLRKATSAEAYDKRKGADSSIRGALAFAPGAGLGMMIFAGMFVGATAFSRDEIMTAVDANFETAPYAQTIRSALYPAPLEAYFGNDTYAALEPIAKATFAPVLRASFEAPAEVLADAGDTIAPVVDVVRDFAPAPTRVRFEEASLRVEPVNVTLTYAEPLEASLMTEPGAFLADAPSIDVIENALYE